HDHQGTRVRSLGHDPSQVDRGRRLPVAWYRAGDADHLLGGVRPLQRVAERPVLVGFERGGVDEAHQMLIHPAPLALINRLRELGHGLHHIPPPPASRLISTPLDRAKWDRALMMTATPSAAASTVRPARRRRRRRSAAVMIGGMLASTGTLVNARRSSTPWNEVSVISARWAVPTAAPMETSRPIRRSRDRFGSTGAREATAGSRMRN